MITSIFIQEMRIIQAVHDKIEMQPVQLREAMRLLVFQIEHPGTNERQGS